MINNVPVKWYTISQNVKLSREFLREFQHRIDWIWICKYQTLTEETILEFKDKVYPTGISYYQRFSNEFIINNLDMLRPEWLLSNTKLELSDQVKLLLQLKIL
jgi:hypothetical protein